MKEESHIEDMRAALRGERERAEEARRRSTENVRALLDVPASEDAPEPPAEPRPQGFLSRVFGR